MELLLGCGNSRTKQVYLDNKKEWNELITLDIDKECNPDVIFDLSYLPLGRVLPFTAEYFDELHAYNVLEHYGKQGDYKGFFTEFKEYCRVLKPKGTFHIIVPHYKSVWAFGDPGHTRVLLPETFSFLNQDTYKNLGKSPTTDYRSVWKEDLKVIGYKEDEVHHYIILQKG